MSESRDEKLVVLHGVKPPAAGSVYAPSYRVGSGTGLNRVLVDHPDFIDREDPDTVARWARHTRVDMEMAGLYWDGNVVVIPPGGVANVRGRVGPFDVLFFQGPVFDAVAANDRKALEAAREAGRIVS